MVLNKGSGKKDVFHFSCITCTIHHLWLDPIWFACPSFVS